MSFTLEGSTLVDKNLEAIARNLPRQAAAALYQIANRIMTESKKIVPLDLGALKGSGHVQKPKILTSGFQLSLFGPNTATEDVSVTMAYGGPSAPYALVQHENLDYEHPGQGEPKYLEKPFMAAAGRLGEEIAEIIRSQINRSITQERVTGFNESAVTGFAEENPFEGE